MSHSIAIRPDDRASARRLLKPVAGRAPRGASLALRADTLAAIGFAAGLALAVGALATGGAVWPWALLMAVSGLARGLMAWLAVTRGAAAARAVKAAVRPRVLAAALGRMPGGSRAGGGWIAAIVDEVEALDGHVARFLPARAASVAAPLLVLGATALASPFAALILIGTLVPFIAAMALAGGAAADRSRRQFTALARLSDLFADRLRALPVILAFDAGEREAARIGTAAREVADRTMKVLRVAFLSSAALEFFAALSVALVAVYAGFQLLGLFPIPVPEALTLEKALFVLALAPEYYAPLRRLAAAYHDRQAAETAILRLAPLLDHPARSGAPSVAGAPALRIEALAVRHQEFDRPAVAGFDLDIAAGERVALVGASGSGKSSVLHALIGLAPREGRIWIDRRPIDPGADLAGIAGWVGQSTLIVPGTLGDNIALGRRNATRAQVEAVAHRVGLGPMLAARGGLDAAIDPRGGGLSGGERRRIAIARALLKDAPLMLLDEPTAHLDPESEASIVAMLADALGGRTVLIATHSPALAALCARSVVMKGAAA